MLTADQLLVTLWRRKVIFLLVFLLTMAAVAVGTYTRPKVYAATAYILVGATRTASSDFEATQTNQVVLKTYAELLQTRSLSTQVAGVLPFPLSARDVEGTVSVAPITQSQLIRITAEAAEAGRAQTLANTYAEVSVERAGRLSEDAGGAITATLADRAAQDNRPIRPRPKLYLGIGALLSALLALGVAIVRDRFDQHLEIDEAANELYGIPILARVPEQPASALRELVHFSDGPHPQNPLTESFDLLLTNIVFASIGTQAKSLAVVSAGEGEGKSTCCVGLARAAVNHDLEVLLVDCDLRRRRLTAMLGLSNEGEDGFSQLLADGADRWSVDTIGAEVSDGLHALAAGGHVAQPTALLSSSFPAFERWSSRAFSLAVFDTSPVAVGADASLVAAATAEVLLVVNVRAARRSTLSQTIDQLHRVQANVVGIILNRTDPSVGPQGYYTDQPERRRARRDEGATTSS